MKEYVSICWRDPDQPLRVRFAFEVFRNTGGKITCYVQFGDHPFWIKRGY